MGQKVQAEVVFGNKFEGELLLKEGSISIGMKPHQTSPHRLLQGALVSCFHSTFMDVMEKKRKTFEGVSYVTEGEKRDEVPATLKTLHMNIVVKGASDEKAVMKSFEMAAKYCSVFQTISHVAEITYNVTFE